MSAPRRIAWAALPVMIAGAFILWAVLRDAGQSITLPDGRVLTVYYYNLFNRYFIGGTTWRP